MHYLVSLINTLALGGIAIYPLLLLAVLMTVIVLDRMIVYIRYARLPTALHTLIESFGFGWNALREELEKIPKENMYARFFSAIYENRNHPVWWVESRAGDESQRIEKSLNQGKWLLETIVTAAPLIGLLGTIIGMMDSFKIIGLHGLIKPEEVTGGVAQALIATAFGLLIALLALFSFNYFSRKNADILDTMERLGTLIVDHIRLDQSSRKEPIK